MSSRARQDAPAIPPKAGSSVRFWTDIEGIVREVGGVIQDRLRLAVLEGKQAGEGLATMIVAAAILAVLLSSAWLGLMGAGVFLLTRNGVDIIPAVMGAVAVNLVLAGFAHAAIRRAKIALQFPATIRSFGSESEEEERPAG